MSRSTRLKCRELERRLAGHGCEAVREGSRHTIGRYPSAGLRGLGRPAPRDPTRYRPRQQLA
ncbi:MAG: hypothetical protein ABSG43_28980, partial [Solirubrobacteraceae bacterium]